MSLQKLDLDIQMPCFLSKSYDNDVVGALSFSPGNSVEMSLDGFPFKGPRESIFPFRLFIVSRSTCMFLSSHLPPRIPAVRRLALQS